MAGTGTGSSGQMSPNTARRLAALIAAGAQQLEERSQELGVTAFLGRPVQRQKPNERFLQNTLRNLASANKRKEEQAMWAAREAECSQQKEEDAQEQQQLQRQQQSWHARPHHTANSRRLGGRKDSSAQHARAKPSSEQLRSRSRSPREQRRSRGRSRSRSRDRHRRCAEARRSPSGSWQMQDGSSSSGSSSNGSQGGSRGGSRGIGRHKAAAPAAVAAAAAAGDPAGPSKQAAQGSPHSSGDWSEGDTGEDQQLLQWLAASKSVRGRGSIGPHADVPGPYLPAPQKPDLLQQTAIKGPEKPQWLQSSGGDEVRMKQNAAFLRGVLSTQGIAAQGAAGGASAPSGGRAAGGADTKASDSSTDSGSSRSSGSRRQHRQSRKRRHDSSRKHKKHKKAKSSKKHKAKRRRH